MWSRGGQKKGLQTCRGDEGLRSDCQRKMTRESRVPYRTNNWSILVGMNKDRRGEKLGGEDSVEGNRRV